MSVPCHGCMIPLHDELYRVHGSVVQVLLPNKPCDGQFLPICHHQLVSAEWASEAKDRELEKIALQHIKEQDKAAAREARVQVQPVAPHSTPVCAAQHLHGFWQIEQTAKLAVCWTGCAAGSSCRRLLLLT